LGPLLFIIYINDISRVTGLGKFVLFADDTNIFVVDQCKRRAFEKANEILHLVHLYMKCNLLHINIKNAVTFTSNYCTCKNDDLNEDDNLFLAIDNVVIKQVKKTKFLGVIIDEKLKWDAHTAALNCKLKCEVCKLCRIRHVIPKQYHKELYHTLFESHLGFGISVLGGINQNRLKPLFVTQKKYVRIIFGDKEVYLDKF
jgi:hypothetical protein